MISLGKIFKKNTGWLRELKAVYAINSWLNRSGLQHNKALYKKYGLNRSILAPIGSHSFPEKHPDIPWLDQENATQHLKEHPGFQQFDARIQQEMIRFIEEGYMILKGFYADEEVDQYNAEIDRLRSTATIDFNYTGRKMMEAFKDSDYINRQFFRNEKLLQIYSFLLGKKVIPFQTINFIQGSEQRSHSDSIHMTTYPEGYLIAAWTALEDVSPENGTIHYYPGSHRLPYLMCPNYDSGNTRYRIGKQSNKHYEDAIQKLIEEKGLKKQLFTGRQGDVFIWHANLLHGGSPILDPERTRKSMVAHYFTEEVICYHEISQRPALL